MVVIVVRVIVICQRFWYTVELLGNILVRPVALLVKEKIPNCIRVHSYGTRVKFYGLGRIIHDTISHAYWIGIHFYGMRISVGGTKIKSYWTVIDVLSMV